MIDYDALRADRAAGTPGPWRLSTLRGHACTMVADDGGHVAAALDDYDCNFPVTTEANARRIARLPDLEDAVLALHEENQRLQRAVLAAEARGLERAAGLCSETRDEAIYEGGRCGRTIATWFSGQANAIRALITPEMRAALEQEQGK